MKNPSTRPCDALVDHGLRIVNQLARRRWRRYRQQIDLDELRAIGREALVQVLGHYDPGLGSFEGYARQRIGGAMADEARKRGRRRVRTRPTVAAGCVGDRLARPIRHTRRHSQKGAHRASVLSRARSEWGSMLTRDDVDEVAMCALPDPESCVMATSLAARVRGVVAGLPAPQRTLIERHYFGDLPLRQVAQELGISRHAVHRLHKKTLGVVERRVQALLGPL